MEVLAPFRRVCGRPHGAHIMLACGCASLGGWVTFLSSPMTHFFQALLSPSTSVTCTLCTTMTMTKFTEHSWVPWSLESDAICFLCSALLSLWHPVTPTDPGSAFPLRCTQVSTFVLLLSSCSHGRNFRLVLASSSSISSPHGV